MKKLICLMVSALWLCGCATAGNLAVTQKQELSVVYPPTVEIKCDPGLSYWWGPWEPDLKDRVSQEITRMLKNARIPVVNGNADIIILIKEIDTGGWTGTIVIGKIVLLGLHNDEEFFQIKYEQRTEMFTLKSFFRPSKDEKQVARILAKEIIKELKNSQSSKRHEV